MALAPLGLSIETNRCFQYRRRFNSSNLVLPGKTLAEESRRDPCSEFRLGPVARVRSATYFVGECLEQRRVVFRS